MTSNLERTGQFSTTTRDFWRRLGADPTNLVLRRNFYTWYLQDVVPREVTACHVSQQFQHFDLSGAPGHGRPVVRREEIQLRCAEGIFYTCLLSCEQVPTGIEEVAATLAYSSWRAGFCVRFHHQAWGMVTCLHQLRFCRSLDGMDWDRVATLHPIDNVREVVAHFRQEYERVRRR